MYERMSPAEEFRIGARRTDDRTLSRIDIRKKV